MTLINATTRRLLPTIVFAVLLTFIFWSWVFMTYLHRDAQYRYLAPEHYKVQVVTAGEYDRLADPAIREVALSDGSMFQKAPAWDRLGPQNYKPTEDGQLYVLVTTRGTAHFREYVNPQLLMFGVLAGCGLFASVWNLKRSS